MIPITDTHLHVWDPSQQSLPWLASIPDLNRAFTREQYERQAREAGIERAVYVEVDVAPAQRWEEIEQVSSVCASQLSPLRAMVAGADPTAKNFEADLERLSCTPGVCGVRRVLHTPSTPQGYCLQPKFIKGIEKLGKAGLTFDLCMRREEVQDAAELAQRCPDTTLVLDHCGNATPGDDEASAWASAMRAVAQRPNTVCKLSGIAIGLNPGQEVSQLTPILELCLEWFGPERVMFGSDWPVCTRRTNVVEWATLLRNLLDAHGDVVANQVLNGTAQRVYGT
jgi:L-fuconolactonase